MLYPFFPAFKYGTYFKKTRFFFERRTPHTQKKTSELPGKLGFRMLPVLCKKMGGWKLDGSWTMIHDPNPFFLISVKFQGCDSEMMQRCSPEPAAHLGYGNPGERGTSRVSQPTNLLPETSNFSW